MSRAGLLFVAVVWLAGLVTGLVLVRSPDLIPLPTPALLVPLAAGLVADLLFGFAVRSGRLQPVTMNERGIGVIGGALIATALGAFASA